MSGGGAAARIGAQLLQPRHLQPLVLGLCSLALLLAGVGGGGAVAWSAAAPYLRARNWQKTDAYVAAVRLNSASNGRGAVVCEAIYTYLVAGRRYRGKRASLYTDADTLFGFHRNLCRRLDENRRANTSTCFYNQHKPDASVLVNSFRPELLSIALAVLTLCGGAGALGAAVAAKKLWRNLHFVPYHLVADETDWPPMPIVSGTYAVLLAAVAIPLSVDTVVRGELVSIVNLVLGASYLIVAAFCVQLVAVSHRAGVLRMPRLANDCYTLCIPSRWKGDSHLSVGWLIDGRFIGVVQVGKPLPIRTIEIDVESPGVDTSHIEFMLPPLPAEVKVDEVVRVRIAGTIGNVRYQGSFMVGLASEFQAAETRRNAGAARVYSM